MSDKRLYFDIFGINVLIALIEIGGRIMTGSITLLADGFHQGGDAAGNFVSIVAEHLVQKGWNEHKVRGWSGIAMSAFLLCAVVEVIREAGERINEELPIIDAPGMSIIAGIACALNGLAWYRAIKTKGMSTCCPIHARSTRKNITSSFTALHQKTDTCISAVVCVSGMSITYTHAYPIDAVISILIAAWLLWGIIVIGSEAVRMIRTA